jgi:hypothetical protein
MRETTSVAVQSGHIDFGELLRRHAVVLIALLAALCSAAIVVSMRSPLVYRSEVFINSGISAIDDLLNSQTIERALGIASPERNAGSINSLVSTSVAGPNVTKLTIERVGEDTSHLMTEVIGVVKGERGPGAIPLPTHRVALARADLDQIAQAEALMRGAFKDAVDNEDAFKVAQLYEPLKELTRDRLDSLERLRRLEADLREYGQQLEYRPAVTTVRKQIPLVGSLSIAICTSLMAFIAFVSLIELWKFKQGR